jgi:hypothetical protein
MADERADINIEDLVLELPFRDPAHARTLVAEIMRRFERMPALPAPRASTRLPDLRLDLPQLASWTSDAQIAEGVAGALHRALSQAVVAADAPPTRQSALGQRRLGKALPETIRAPLERGLGADLEDVRVHTDGAGSALAARFDADAVTVGEDIYFKEGRFRPQTAEGRRLLAHELTHVAQQRLDGTPAGSAFVEREASEAAGKLVAGQSARVRQPAAREAVHPSKPTKAPVREVRSERVFGDLYIAELVVQGIDFRLAISRQDQDHVLARLADVAAQLARINRSISDPKAKVRLCVIANGQDSRFATYNGAPVVVLSPQGVTAAAAVHEADHAVFESLRSAEGPEAETKHSTVARLGELFNVLSRTTHVSKVTRQVAERQPVGLLMLDPTQWSGEPKTEHPWENADEMFASALEGLVTNPAGLRRAIHEAVRIDRHVDGPAKELMDLVSTIARGRAPKVKTPSAGQAEQPEPPDKIETYIDSPAVQPLKWALEPDTVPDND